MRSIILLAGLALACAGCAGPYDAGGYYGSPAPDYGYPAPYAYGYGSSWSPGWGVGAPAPLFGGVVIGGHDRDHHDYDRFRHEDHAANFVRNDHATAHYTPRATPHVSAAAPRYQAPRAAAVPHYRAGPAPGTGINAGRNYGGPG